MSPARQPTFTTWERLSPFAQRLLACCSVFAGSFDLDRATHVVAFSKAVVRSALRELVQASMLDIGVDAMRPVYRVPTLVRPLATASLDEAGLTDDARRRDAHHIADVFSDEFPIARPDVFDRFGWDDTLGATRWALQAEPPLGVHLAANLWPHWRRLSAVGTGRDLLASALGTGAGSAVDRARATVGAGVLAGDEGDALAAAESTTSGAEAARAAGDYAAEALALAEISGMALLDGCGAGADDYAGRALDCARRSGLRWGEAYAHLARSRVAVLRGEPVTAHRDLEESLTIALLVGDRSCAAIAKVELGRTALLRGDVARARDYLHDALAEAEAIGDVRASSSALVGLGLVARAEHRWDDADAHLRQAVELAARSADPVAGCAAVLELASSRAGAGGGDLARSFDDLAAATLAAFEANAYVLLPRCYQAASELAIDVLGPVETDWLRHAASYLQQRFGIAPADASSDPDGELRIGIGAERPADHPAMAPFMQIVRWFSDEPRALVGTAPATYG